MSMPENHLDVVVAPDSINPDRPASLITRLIAVIAMPLFFLVSFTLSYVSATHEPQPHDMALVVAGPIGATSSVAEALDNKAPHAFDVRQTSNQAEARSLVRDRHAVGALIIDSHIVTAVVASAGGRLAVPFVENVAKQVAAGLDAKVVVDEVAPLPTDDPSGTSLFFLLVICTVGGFLTITVVSQVLPQVRTKGLLAAAVGAGIFIPVIGFSMISLFVDFGATFGSAAAVIGVAMIYTFTVALIAAFFTRVLGQAAVLGEILFLVALNFPSAGASVPAPLLPGFWQVVHDGWLGAGSFEAMRSLLFFDGAQAVRWLLQLIIWTFGALVLFLVAGVLKSRRQSATPPTSPLATATVEPDRHDSELEDVQAIAAARR